MAEFANQFGNTLCPDKISFDAFKTELEAKVKELNEKYPKTMPLKISSGSGFIQYISFGTSFLFYLGTL
jgi:hypothetical protein